MYCGGPEEGGGVGIPPCPGPSSSSPFGSGPNGSVTAASSFLTDIVTTLVIPEFTPITVTVVVAAIVIDYDTKEVLFEINADTRNYPASLTKMMTLYILFDNLEKGKLTEKKNP